MVIASIAAAAAGVCAALAIADSAASARDRGAVAGACGPAARPAGAPGPGGRARLAAVLAAMGRRLGRPAAPAGLQARLDAAGVSMGLADAMALKCGAAAAALPIAGTTTTALLPGRPGLLALGAAPLAGFFALDLWLVRVRRERSRLVGLELADVVDLLRVAVDAGLPPARAVAEVGARHGGLLGVELRAVAARIELGLPRAEALAIFSARCPNPAIAMLVAALERTHRHGAPLAPALEALAVDARAERARQVRDRAARAAPKIQLVIALLLVPAVMLLVAAALTDALL